MKHKSGKLLAVLREIFEYAVICVVALVVFTIFPVVNVVSGSMYHGNSDDWRTWLIDHNISEEQISGFPFQEGFERGDIFITVRSSVKLGDVVIYERNIASASQQYPIIHRIVGVVTIENGVVEVEGTLDCLNKEDVLNYVKTNIENSNKNKITVYITKGDNPVTNKVSDQCGGISFPVTEDKVISKASIKIPKIGQAILFIKGE